MKTTLDVLPLILGLRGQKVILSADLADIYGVEPRVLNQAVKRNGQRFPADFAFALTKDEFDALKAGGMVMADGRAALRSQIVTLKRGAHAKHPPMSFTEHGAIMAATVLSSPLAVKMSVFVVRAFVRMREHLAANAAILRRLAEIDKTLLEHDQALGLVWRQIQPLLQPPPDPPKRRIGFNPDDSP